MGQDNQPVEKPTEKQPDKDEKGKFAKGNKIGNRFSRDNQPISPGRPKSKTLTDALLAHLTKKASKFPFTTKAAKSMKMDPDEVTCIEVLMATTFLHGMKGKGDILKEMWARIEGSVPKNINLGSDDPVQVYINDMRNATEPEQPKEPEQEPPKESDDPAQ